ncbi:MAG TPA: beta-ketoacyl-ACP synthase 3 [Frankiaceae bacterium]|jgi:3-oxoacyl-[acyl-carrier-protein] synthase-3|nr:beta-ketoacyl-ACP synthase 3 [Frankiaceae bacterium]
MTENPAILGLGAYRPAGRLTNADLVARLDTSDEWIVRRTGISERRVAGPDDTLVAMGVDAGAKALAAAGVQGGDVDLVIAASCTAQAPIPGIGPRIAAGVGASAAGAFDLNAGCAGFCYALSMAADAVRAGNAKRVLVVASERLTDWVDSDDRGMAILFGDAAGAALVGAPDPASEAGIGPVAWGSDGSVANVIEIRTRPDGREFMEMEGSAVFRWATTQLVPVARRACDLAGVAPEELSAIVLHQANLRITESIARSLGAPQAILARDIVDAGNTSAASVPLALSRLIDEGQVGSGDRVLLFAFGAGLTYAGQVVRLP